MFDELQFVRDTSLDDTIQANTLIQFFSPTCALSTGAALSAATLRGLGLLFAFQVLDSRRRCSTTF
jgi:hypothetical protein